MPLLCHPASQSSITRKLSGECDVLVDGLDHNRSHCYALLCVACVCQIVTMMEEQEILVPTVMFFWSMYIMNFHLQFNSLFPHTEFHIDRCPLSECIREFFCPAPKWDTHSDCVQ